MSAQTLRQHRALADYMTPVSVDAFGTYPGKKPGDVFEVMYHGKVYIAEVQAGDPRKMANGAVLRDIRFRQAEGPVTRNFVADPQITNFLAKEAAHGIA